MDTIVEEACRDPVEEALDRLQKTLIVFCDPFNASKVNLLKYDTADSAAFPPKIQAENRLIYSTLRKAVSQWGISFSNTVDSTETKVIGFKLKTVIFLTDIKLRHI